ncbi:MAG: tRNA pseudouridine(38-40) synthase TruA [Candidatus Omnitrophota bacterium]
MRNVKLTIEYDGARFSGWQTQVRNKRKTIQQEIIKACKKLLREKVNLIGAGRTDAGVHAEGQVANFRTRSHLPLYNIKKGLNRYLPRDIAILKAEEVGVRFHAQHDALRKLYRYTIINKKERSPLMSRYTSLVTYDLDIGKMKRSAKPLKGRKDFRSFQASDKKERSSIRAIKRLEIIKKGHIIEVLIEADGFLYNMVRNIVGTLIDVGRGFTAPEKVKDILAGKNRKLAGKTAPAKGLTLVKAYYGKK